MFRWTVRRVTRPSAAAGGASEAPAASLELLAPPRADAEGDGYLQACRQRLSLEVDDGLLVPVLLDDQNAARVLETTQCLREQREREKATLAPVLDFGAPAAGAAGAAADW